MLPPTQINLISYIHSPPKLLLLQRPKHHEAERRKRKRQLEADVAPVRRVADPLAHGPDEPDLRHAHDGAEDAEAKGHDGCQARRQEARVVPDGDVVFAALEDEVLGQGDAFVDGEPVALFTWCQGFLFVEGFKSGEGYRRGGGRCLRLRA